MVQELVANLPAVLYVLVLGSWSDKYGRKLPMLLPFVGSFLATVIYMVRNLVCAIFGVTVIVALSVLLCR